MGNVRNRIVGGHRLLPPHFGAHVAGIGCFQQGFGEACDDRCPPVVDSTGGYYDFDSRRAPVDEVLGKFKAVNVTVGIDFVLGVDGDAGCDVKLDAEERLAAILDGNGCGQPVGVLSVLIGAKGVFKKVADTVFVGIFEFLGRAIDDAHTWRIDDCGLVPVLSADTNGPATDFRIAEGRNIFGLKAPVAGEGIVVRAVIEEFEPEAADAPAEW